MFQLQTSYRYAANYLDRLLNKKRNLHSFLLEVDKVAPNLRSLCAASEKVIWPHVLQVDTSAGVPVFNFPPGMAPQPKIPWIDTLSQVFTHVQPVTANVSTFGTPKKSKKFLQLFFNQFSTSCSPHEFNCACVSSPSSQLHYSWGWSHWCCR